jgi:hypothetical protein
VNRPLNTAEIQAQKVSAAEAQIKAAVEAAGQTVTPEALAFAASCMVGWGGAAEASSAYTNSWSYQPDEKLLRIERDAQTALVCLKLAQRVEANLRKQRAA